VLDNKVISAPVIREPILGGSGQISGNFTVETANELGILLRGGALPAPLKVIEERTIGPNLGADAIRVGIYACAIGGFLVIAFMLYFYRLFGVLASIGMITNLALLIGVLSLLQASLMLPGTALGVAMIAMLVYIWARFEWQFGVGATMTLLLDVTKMVGVYALLQFQFNTTSIVAILTIMGYSINDKVVVYDRVRENLRLFRRMSLRELIDRSINETLSRTIATSGTVFLAILPLALMSAGDIRQFATVLLIGIVIGTSSSIFIAAPILLLLGEGRLRPRAAALAQDSPVGAHASAGSSGA
jgi:preprotein translocase subunit SecF